MNMKKEARRRAGELRRAAGAEAHAALIAAAAAALADEPGLILGAYRPIGSEPEPLPAALAWLSADAGRRLALPWCLDRGASTMEYRLWTPGEPLESDAAGIPSAGGGTAVPDVLLIPCLGWARSGRRLGYGGGYFDRWIAARRAEGRCPRLVGLAFAACEVEEALFETWDLPLDLIVTELETVRPAG